MRDDGLEAGRKKPTRGGSARRPEARKLRVQWHLGAETVERLGVHCSMAHRNPAAMVDEILGNYLRRHGKGREAFGEPDSGDSAGPVISEGQGDLAAPAA